MIYQINPMRSPFVPVNLTREEAEEIASRLNGGRKLTDRRTKGYKYLSRWDAEQKRKAAPGITHEWIV